MRRRSQIAAVIAAAMLTPVGHVAAASERAQGPFSLLVTTSAAGVEMRCSGGCAWTMLSYACSKDAPCWAKVDERGIEGRPADAVQGAPLKRFRLVVTVGEAGFSLLCKAGCGWNWLSYRCSTPGSCTAVVDAAGVRRPEPAATGRAGRGPQ